jgi:NAD(P)-dependent dehydrogenase (short-subunit alcohol dehydrogenase family)
VTATLAGSVVLVTGGASGIGKATAELFARNGATVVVADRTPAAGALTVDVSDSAAVDRMVAGVLQEHGKIDILVHCPAILKIVPIVETTDEDWTRIIDVNLNGAFYTSRAVARAMIPRKAGRIVLITSGRGAQGAPRNAAYAAAKGGMNAFMLSLARELSADGIYVNCVDPGSTETPLMRQAQAGNAVRSTDPGKPEEVAETIFFVATNDARITGQIVSLRQR